MDPQTAKALIDALHAERAIVAVVGAGGKKSTLYRLLEAHRAVGTRRLLLTSTVQIRAAPNALGLVTLTVDDDDVEAAIARCQGQDGAFLFVGAPIKPGWFRGLPRALIQHLHAHGGFDVSLVKADGARMRMIKGLGDDEPALPEGVSTILPIVSARAFGRPLTERLVHRPERLANVIGADIGADLTPDHVAKLLASPDGLLRHAGTAMVVPVINMVDSPERLILARKTAIKALAMTERFERVVLASMTSASPLIEVVTG